MKATLALLILFCAGCAPSPSDVNSLHKQVLTNIRSAEESGVITHQEAIAADVQAGGAKMMFDAGSGADRSLSLNTLKGLRDYLKKHAHCEAQATFTISTMAQTGDFNCTRVH